MNDSYSPTPTPPPLPGSDGSPAAAPSWGSRIKKALGPLAVVFLFLSKIKGFLLAGLKLFPQLKTGLTMFVTIWVYSTLWGWPFAVGFVILIFIHECGHLLAAKRLGLKVGWPVFIPFMGALIALKEAPRDAWVEAQVGIGGPLLGTAGAVASYCLGLVTGNPIFLALAYTGFFLNLFNLAPIGFLDGGRIVAALSPWLWVVGTVILGTMLFFHFNFIVLLILVMSLPRLLSLFRKKSEEERRYFEVTPKRRLLMGGLYFGLAVFLTLGMVLAYVHPPARQAPERPPIQIQQL